MAMNLPSRSGRGRRAPMADINVTPLVDVMLVLLIIFMVTAPLLTSGVPVNLPDSRAKALDQEQKPEQIAIDEQGRMFLNDDEITEANLPARLDAIAARKGPDGQVPQVYLRADRALDYGRVMRVMGELNRAGLNRVSLVTVEGGPAQERARSGRPLMERGERIGLAIAVAGHIVLFGLLSVGFLSTPNPEKLKVTPIDISLVKDVALRLLRRPRTSRPPSR